MKNLALVGMLLMGLNCHAMGGMIGGAPSFLVANCQNQVGDELFISENIYTGDFFAAGTGTFSPLGEPVTMVANGVGVTGFTSNDFSLMLSPQTSNPPVDIEVQVQYPLGTSTTFNCTYNGVHHLN
jgi:hypothetical protein